MKLFEHHILYPSHNYCAIPHWVVTTGACYGLYTPLNLLTKHRLGNIYCLMGTYYLLSQVDYSKYQLITLNSQANRWTSIPLDCKISSDDYFTEEQWKFLAQKASESFVLVGRLKEVRGCATNSIVFCLQE